VFYDLSSPPNDFWGVFNQSTTQSMPKHAAFNLLIYSS